jgi:hypothetical protein
MATLSKEMVSSYLGEMTNVLDRAITLEAKGEKKHKGLDNNSMIYFIKAWTKISIGARDRSYRRSSSAFLDSVGSTNARVLTKKYQNLSYPENAQRLSNAYSESLDRQDSTLDGGFFQDADDAMMAFFVNYWRQIVGQKDEKDFAQKVKDWTSKSPDQVLNDKTTFKMDQ